MPSEDSEYRSKDSEYRARMVGIGARVVSTAARIGRRPGCADVLERSGSAKSDETCLVCD
ncbi:hypothetical protein Tcan_03350 [Toxocara canis]|uniref:Uncharacterized protein n=1 Tax=Toxocara canis TaxID=6265 RepID=A0A0B2W604_TOXCA|nr:hypothetical protein Tcan_03350 [Toxocara canis]